MRSRQAGRARGRWSEVLLGGLAGLGVPVLLLGTAAQGPGRPRSPATVGVVAGLLGAWVGSGLARRRRGAPTLAVVPAAPRKEARALEPGPRPDERPEPRRAPSSGRERQWGEWETPVPAR
jgi:hypothetical protein